MLSVLEMGENQEKNKSTYTSVVRLYVDICMCMSLQPVFPTPSQDNKAMRSL